MNKLEPQEKKQLIIFFLIAFAVPYVLGIPMGIAYNKGIAVDTFPNAQMFYPAAGAILALLVTQWKNPEIPKKFYITYLVFTAVMLIMSVASVLVPGLSWTLYIQYPIILCSVILLILLMIEKKNRKQTFGLSNLGKGSFVCVLLFAGLYLLRILLGALISGESPAPYLLMFKEPSVWLMVFAIFVNYFFSFSAFFGEEYGWRYFLQPKLQKAFGLRNGILVLGVLWGLWHLPINIFYYSPDTWILSVISQIALCISLGVFLAYAYLKTQNIWVPVIMHYMNNNFILLFTGSADSIKDQVLTWGTTLLSVAVLLVIYMPFFASKVFSKQTKDTVAADSSETV